MAEPAGIINRYGPKDDAAFREIVADATPEIQELAHAVRERRRRRRIQGAMREQP